ncbi:MATE efflux family protein [Cristinia sonorae]|uniref:MATE efflux family protein n=1 Tax=Cristinia sonorae TaxID=1940300 RepID=A0A8K0XKH1_9AGAR|nr:MATE efflux family protein [Cristinia sonorae]
MADENQPLLRKKKPLNTLDIPHSGPSSIAAVNLPDEAAGNSAKSFGAVGVDLFIDSIPVILSYILQNSIQAISVLIVGRLGPDELSAAALAIMFAFVTGMCIALGGTTALDTLASQAFTGGTKPSDVSIHFQRCVIVLWALFIPVSALWIRARPVLLLLGQGERVSEDVQTYLRVFLFGAPGYIAFESLKKYLQCQGIMRASTIALVLVAPVNIALNIILIHYTPLGFLGSPVAVAITYWLCFFVLIILTYISPTFHRNKTWEGLQLRAVLDPRSCWEFIKLAVPGIFMVGTEWTAFQIVALAAGRLGAIPLAAQAVIMTTDEVLNSIPFGIGIAASTRVGNLIGARAAYDAKRASHAAALVSVIIGSIVMASMLAAKNVYGYMFSDDEAVVHLVSQVLPLVASFQIADGLAGSCGGVLRGQGRQHLGAMFNLVAYYVLALPLGITLAFHPRTHRGLEGLWIGQVVALFIVGIGEYGTVWLATDWDKEVQKGIERNEAEAKRRALYERALPSAESEIA